MDVEGELASDLHVEKRTAEELMEPGGSREEGKKAAIVVFYSNMGLCTMRTADEINIDGTFSSAPPPFKQIVFIQAKQAGKRSIPVVFALLSNKVGNVKTYFICLEIDWGRWRVGTEESLVCNCHLNCFRTVILTTS